MHSDNLINDDLYRQIILDHYSRPRHNCHLEHPTVSVEGTNPTCGDEIELDDMEDLDDLTEDDLEEEGMEEPFLTF